MLNHVFLLFLCDILPLQAAPTAEFLERRLFKMACDYELTLQIAKDITVAALSNSPLDRLYNFCKTS